MIETTHFTDAERAYLLEMLRARHDELLRELHHADRREFRQRLREAIAIHESITAKVSS